METPDFSPVQPLGRAQLSHRRPAAVDHFWFGCCYYPEHWDAATRRHDAALMAQAGFNVVRMAEFAWDLIEPQPGYIDFSLFDATIAELGANGVSTILCTPTATPPRWLTRDHPEILREAADGRRMQHGSRQQADINHPLFREHSRRITRIMAEHYRDNPHVVGWQTDNEFYCHLQEDHSPAAQAAFQSYLRVRYNYDIASLNAAWGTAFWAQTYAAFDDIPTPREQRPTYLNPGHQLDYYRFLSETVARFQHEQVAILRETSARWFVFHNGIFHKTDYRGLFTQDLDFLGYDVYPLFVPDSVKRAAAHAFNQDRARSWSGNFIIPEHQSGAGGQNTYSLMSAEPGELRLLTWRSIARGADGLLYFRWRTCRFGAEQYWRGIIEHDNVPRRRYHEVAAIGAEIKRAGQALLGTSVLFDCAVATPDYEVREAHRTYPMGLPFPDEAAELIHGWLYQEGFAAGCVHPADDLSAVRLLVIPHWALFREDWVEPLQRWVEAGGTLVVGARTGTRNGDNQIVSTTPPGLLASLCGVRVIDFGRIDEKTDRSYPLAFGGDVVEAACWWEELELDASTEVVAQWSGRFLSGTAAVTRRSCGRGQVYYVATQITEDLLPLLMPEVCRSASLERVRPAASGSVEIVERSAEGKALTFYLNSGDETVILPDVPAGLDLFTGEPFSGGSLELEPFAVRLLQR